MHWSRKKTVWAVLSAAAVAVLLVAIPRPHEPVHEGKPLSYWLSELRRQPGPGARNQLRAAVAEIGPKAIPFLLHEIRRQDSVWGPLSRAIWLKLPSCLAALIPRPPPDNKMFRVRIVSVIKPEGASAFPHVLPALKERSSEVRLAAVEVIVAIDPKPPEIIPAMMKLLETPDPDGLIRCNAANILGDFGPAAMPAVPALTRVMQADKRDTVREFAARALAQVGTAAPADLPGIKQGLRDRSSEVRPWSAIALWRASHDTNLMAYLASELGASQNPSVCLGILSILGNAGAAAESAILPIRRKLKECAQAPPDLRFPVLHAVREALRKLDPETVVAPDEGR